MTGTKPVGNGKAGKGANARASAPPQGSRGEEQKRRGISIPQGGEPEAAGPRRGGSRKQPRVADDDPCPVVKDWRYYRRLGAIWTDPGR